MKWYRHKTVVITGASSGIGEALAISLAPYQTFLILIARRESELERVAIACRDLGAEVICVVADLYKKEDINSIMMAVQGCNRQIDVLINNAGISQRANVMDTEEKTERQLMEINYFTPVLLSKLMFPLFSKDAKLVIISSLSGLFGFPQRSTYAASKHALKGYFESWQVESDFPKITLVYPGRIQSKISLNALTGNGTQHALMDKAQQKGIPADQCANLILAGVIRNKKRLLIGRKELILYWFYKYFPPLYYKIASSIKANG